MKGKRGTLFKINLLAGIICSIQNEAEPPDKCPDKWLGMFICTLLELKSYGKTKTNGVEIIFNITL